MRDFDLVYASLSSAMQQQQLGVTKFSIRLVRKMVRDGFSSDIQNNGHMSHKLHMLFTQDSL
jgi:hypothetical protein